MTSTSKKKDEAKLSPKEAAMKATKLFIDSVRRKESPEKSFRHLGISTKEDVMKWVDDNDLDLMHHTIILNNPEAAEYLLSHGFFQMPFEPRTNMYAHLACLLGHRTVLNIILQYRPDDNRASSKLSYDPKGDDSVRNSRRRETMPIDVAAEAGHLQCVKQILDQCIIKNYPEFAKYPYVALACITGSTSAMTLLMKKDKPKASDLTKAVEVALKAAMPQCLDLLLDEDVKPGDVFDKMNFYHVLYTYTATNPFRSDGYRRLPEVTQVLVKHKHNVNSKSPPNTYPLYSLIRNSFCIHDYVNARHYMMCLRILLEAGADPNFDEFEHEQALNKRGTKSVHGRQSYSSGLHCLIDTVEFYSEYLDSTDVATKFVTSMGDILFQNKAKINMVGHIGNATSKLRGTVLHQFAKCSVNLGVYGDILKFLLRQGADPNSRAEGKYAINLYFDALFDRLGEELPWKKQSEMMEDVQQMLNLSLHMYRKSVKETLLIFKDSHSKQIKKHIKPFVSVVIKELENRSEEVWPLKRLCRSLIWDLCSRNAQAVHSLPTDIESRTYILPIL